MAEMMAVKLFKTKKTKPAPFIPSIKEEIDLPPVDFISFPCNDNKENEFARIAEETLNNPTEIMDVAMMAPINNVPLKVENQKPKALKKKQTVKKPYVDVPSHFRRGKPVRGYSRRNERAPSSCKLQQQLEKPLSEEEKKDRALAYSLKIQETLKLTRGKMN